METSPREERSMKMKKYQTVSKIALSLSLSMDIFFLVPIVFVDPPEIILICRGFVQ